MVQSLEWTGTNFEEMKAFGGEALCYYSFREKAKPATADTYPIAEDDMLEWFEEWKRQGLKTYTYLYYDLLTDEDLEHYYQVFTEVEIGDVIVKDEQGSYSVVRSH